MKTFQRFKTLEEIKSDCAAKKWLVDSTKHDNDGHDHVSIQFSANGKRGVALFNTFNGRFFGKLSHGEEFDGQNDKHEKETWFNALLETFYA